MKRIGILTAGGDTPALNAAIHGAVVRANRLRIEIYGLIKGFNCLFNPRVPHVHLNPLFQEIPELDATKGGTLIGSRKGMRCRPSHARNRISRTLEGDVSGVEPVPSLLNVRPGMSQELDQLGHVRIRDPDFPQRETQLVERVLIPVGSLLGVVQAHVVQHLQQRGDGGPRPRSDSTERSHRRRDSVVVLPLAN